MSIWAERSFYHARLLIQSGDACRVVTDEVGMGKDAAHLRETDESLMHRGHGLWLATLKWVAEGRGLDHTLTLRAGAYWCGIIAFDSYTLTLSAKIQLFPRQKLTMEQHRIAMPLETSKGKCACPTSNCISARLPIIETIPFER